MDEPTNEFELKKDENINTEITTDKFKITFLFLILEYYLEFIKNNKKEIIPNEVKNNKTEWVGENIENNIIKKFLEEYTITNNKDDFVQSLEIDNWIKDTKQTITMSKFAIELKKYCSIKKFNNVESKQKKINGKNKQSWIGIKRGEDDSDSDEEMIIL